MAHQGLVDWTIIWHKETISERFLANGSPELMVFDNVNLSVGISYFMCSSQV